MANILRVDFDNKQIVMDRTFAVLCADTRSDEYEQLQRVRQDYPTYDVITKRIRKNPNKNTYKGLTYDYMESYILIKEKGEDKLKALDEFNEQRLLSECHSKARRYPVIKRWFLAKYPEVAEFGQLKIAVSE